MDFIGILLAIVLFLFLITIHESGHFIGAKLSGIKVNEFSIGMGPSLFKKQGQETLYSFRLLPIGGYVMMEGEDESSSDPRSYKNSAAWKRFLTILAGPFTNFLFGFLVFVLLANFSGYASNTIDQVIENSPASIAGLEKGDKIVKVNGKNTYIFNQISKEINDSDKKLDLEIERNGKKHSYTLETEIQDNRKVVGIVSEVKKDFLGSLKYGFQNTIFMTSTLWEGLKGLVTGVFGLENLSGPIGVISQVGKSVSYGFLTYINMAAFISINLGLFNLLPIPALDGSKLLFNLFEMITGKKVNEKFETTITFIGFIALLALILVVSYNDIVKIFK